VLALTLGALARESTIEDYGYHDRDHFEHKRFYRQDPYDRKGKLPMAAHNCNRQNSRGVVLAFSKCRWKLPRRRRILSISQGHGFYARSSLHHSSTGPVKLAGQCDEADGYDNHKGGK
jgi:hypothetical protein